jgi:hypothetical protein
MDRAADTYAVGLVVAMAGETGCGSVALCAASAGGGSSGGSAEDMRLGARGAWCITFGDAAVVDANELLQGGGPFTQQGPGRLRHAPDATSLPAMTEPEERRDGTHGILSVRNRIFHGVQSGLQEPVAAPGPLSPSHRYIPNCCLARFVVVHAEGGGHPGCRACVVTRIGIRISFVATRKVTQSCIHSLSAVKEIYMHKSTMQPIPCPSPLTRQPLTQTCPSSSGVVPRTVRPLALESRVRLAAQGISPSS